MYIDLFSLALHRSEACMHFVALHASLNWTWRQTAKPTISFDHLHNYDHIVINSYFELGPKRGIAKWWEDRALADKEHENMFTTVWTTLTVSSPKYSEE